MPPLSNLRHEQFAQLVARGASATQAYGEAGYSTKSDQVAARVSGQVARLPPKHRQHSWPSRFCIECPDRDGEKTHLSDASNLLLRLT